MRHQGVLQVASSHGRAPVLYWPRGRRGHLTVRRLKRGLTKEKGIEMSQAEETLGRLASCLCEGEEVDLEGLGQELAARLIPLLASPLAGPGATLQQAFEAAGAGHEALATWVGDAPRLAWSFGQEGLPMGVTALLGWPYGRVLGDALCFECALLASVGVGEVCLAANTAALVEGEFDEAMDPVLSVIRTAHADDEDAYDCEDDCDCDDEDACACGHDHKSACGCDNEACTCEDGDCACGHDHDCGCDDGAASGHAHECACGCDDDGCTCEQGRDRDCDYEDDACGCGCDDDDCACEHDHDCDCGDDACGCGHDDDDCCDGALAVGVAIECGQLTPQVLCQAVDAISSAHPDYVVACTGSERCATPEDVRLVCATVEPGVAVRATTDARTVAEAVELFEAGAVELMCLHSGQILLDFDRLATSL